MKTKFLTIVFAVVMIFGVNSCGKEYFEDKIASPNDPTEVSPNLLLTTVQVATFANYGGQLARQSGVMTQHLAGTSAGSQTVQIANYNITELTNGNEWNVIYAGVVVNCRIIIETHGNENPYYRGMARILKVMNAMVATDLWGNVPFADAGSALGEDVNLNPAYDNQSDIYDDANPNSMFAELDAAISDLGAAPGDNARLPADDDLIFGGDVMSWIKAAHSLKARLYNHLSQVNPSSSATNALAELASAITTSSENAYLQFGGLGNEQNQWYAYNLQRGDYIKMGEFFVDTMKNTMDPRLAFFANTDPNGNYTGTPKDDVDSIATSNIGSYLNSPLPQIPLIGYVEMKFIEAEANLRAGNSGPAATALNDAVKASILEVTGAADPAYEATYASETGASITLEKIMTQKYIAMFGQIESYTDFRRTGFPSGVTPNPAANISTIPVRFILPQSERLYNSNAPKSPPSLSEPVWWDQ